MKRGPLSKQKHNQKVLLKGNLERGKPLTTSMHWDKWRRKNAKRRRVEYRVVHSLETSSDLCSEQRSSMLRRKRKLVLEEKEIERKAISHGTEESSTCERWKLLLFCACIDIYIHPCNSTEPYSQKRWPQSSYTSIAQTNDLWISLPFLSCTARCLHRRKGWRNEEVNNVRNYFWYFESILNQSWMKIELTILTFLF